ARRSLPVDPPHLVPRDVLADAPEVGPCADSAGGDLPEPRPGPPRLEGRASQVLHRGRDDEGGPQVHDGILRAEGERIEGPRPDRPEDEISFDRRGDRAEREDDDRRQGEEDDLPRPRREAEEEETEGGRGEAAGQRRPHVTAPSGPGPGPGRPRGPSSSAPRGSRGPA